MDPREEILRHASILLSTKGVGATRLADVARAVEVTPGAIYYHFRGLDEIVDALLDYVVEETRAFAVTGDDGIASCSVRLHRLIHQHLERLTSGPYDLWFITRLSEAEAFRHKPLGRLVVAWNRVLGDLLAEGAAADEFVPVDTTIAVAAISSLVSAALQLRHEHGEVDHSAIATIAVRSVAAHPAPWPTASDTTT